MKNLINKMMLLFIISLFITASIFPQNYLLGRENTVVGKKNQFSIYLPQQLSPTVCTPPPNDLVAWYRAENNSLDASGNSNNGTFTQSGSFAAGHVGQGLNFVTGSNVVEATDNAMLSFTNAFTIEMWVSPTTVGLPNGNTFLISKGDMSQVHTQSYGIIYSDTRRIFNRIGNNSMLDQVGGTTLLPLNIFSHIAITYDGITLRVYINGALDTSKVTSIGTLLDSTQPLVIGGANFGGNFVSAEAIIDETSLYSRELSLAEIQTIFNAGASGKCVTQTAASASISGRVSTINNQGIPNAYVQITDQFGNIQTAQTNHFGYYNFAEIMVGQLLIFDIIHKQYQFDTNVLDFNEGITGLNFTPQQ